MTSSLCVIGVADDMMKTKTKGVSSDVSASELVGAVDKLHSLTIKILERTLRGENTEALDTWLKTASPHGTTAECS